MFKILIIEDSPIQSAIIAELVFSLGHDPIVYNSVNEGINQILSKENPDLVLLDLKLIDEMGKEVANGFQICKEIKRISQNLPVIIVSSESDDDAYQWAFLQGADAYLQKPFVASEFSKVISRVLKEVGNL